MNTCIRSLIVYFEQVLHPASGWAERNSEKKKRRSKSIDDYSFTSPESFNTRGLAKKQDKLRRNPAP
jgi:hypothetical protein